MDVLGRIRDQIDLRRVRLKDALQAFDQLHTKKVTQAQFFRCLSMHGIEVTPSEEELLFKRYRTSDNFIYYYMFLDDIEKQIPSSQMASSETFGQTKSRKLVASGCLDERPRDGMDSLDDVLRFLKKRAQTHGLIVKNFFVDFDRVKTGYVSETQFRRGMKVMIEGVPDPIVDLLVNRYGYQTSSRTKDVNYDAMQKDVDRVQFEVEYPFPWTEKLIHPYADTSYSLNEIYELFWRRMQEQRVRPKDFFKTFDHLNVGFISKAEFCRAMSMARMVDVDAEKIEQLAQKYYKPERAKVNYLEFVNDLEKMSFARSITGYQSSLPHGFDRTSTLPKEKVDLLTPILEEMKEKIRVEGIHLKPTFQDFDPINEEHITIVQFDRVLKRMNLLPSSESILELLHQRFCAVGGDHQRVNYRRYLEAVDPFAWPAPPEFQTNRRPPSPIVVPQGVSEVLSQLRQRISQNRIRLKEFLEDYDPLRHGQITTHQLEAALGLAGFDLTQEELQILYAAYKVPKRDSTGQDFVDYPGLLLDLNRVFEFNAVDPRSVPSQETLNTTAVLDSKDYSPTRLTESEASHIREVMNTLKKYYESHRIHLTPDFQHFDWHNHGYITRTQFERVLKNLNLFSTVSEPDIQLVCKAFAMPHRDSRDDVNYKWFVQCLENLNVESVLSTLPSMYQTFLPAKSDWPSIGVNDTARHAQYGPVFNTMNLGKLLSKLQYLTRYHRIRLETLLEDYMPLRQDWCPKAKLRTAFTSAGFVLMEEEYQQLEQRYEHPTKKECVEWRRLLADIRSAPSSDSNGLSSTDVFDTAMKRMKYLMWTETINAKPVFQTFDPQNIGRVTVPQFHRCLDTVGLTRGLTEEEVQSVIAKYTTEERDTKSMADYVTYISDVENYYSL